MRTVLSTSRLREYLRSGKHAVFLPNTYGLTLFENRNVSHHYSVVEQFGAVHLGKHGICAYLINLSTGDTYAYAGAFWTNHS